MMLHYANFTEEDRRCFIEPFLCAAEAEAAAYLSCSMPCNGRGIVMNNALCAMVAAPLSMDEVEASAMKRFVKCFFELLTQISISAARNGQENLLRNIPFCSLGEVGGAGAEPPQNLTIAAEVVQTVLLLEWSGRKRRAGFFILFPVFGGEMATAKIQIVKGIRVEIFSRTLRNGHRTGIVFDGEICYTLS